MALSDAFCRNVKWSGTTKAGDKHADGGGLYLHVMPNGSKLWRMAYRFAGKQKTLALGAYPALLPTAAHKARDEAKKLLAAGTDPSQARRADKAIRAVAAGHTFEAVARDFHTIKAPGWSPTYGARWIERMEKDLFPRVGSLPLPTVNAALLLDALRKVEARGARETAHNLRQMAGQVFRHGVQTGRCERNPAADLAGALQPLLVRHMPAVLEPVKAGELLRAIDGYSGQPLTRAALLLSALTFQRPGNIRALQWDWIDLDAAMLTIPAEAMKRRIHQKVNGRPHFVPLAPQAVAVLREIEPLSGSGRYVFPSLRTSERPMSENTINAALRRMGYASEEMTAHGFRAMARTLMVEHMGTHPDVIEAQLAHGKSGPLGMAYDRAEFMAQRRQMMSEWANYLDRLRQGADVIQLHQKAG